MLVGFILVFVGCIEFFAADATCWGIKIIDLNISWFQILKGSIAIPKLSVKWLGWIKDISIFCWWKSWCILVEIHTFGSDSPSPSYFGQIPQQLVTSAYSCRWQSFFGYTHIYIYIYSRFVVGYTLIFRIYLSPFLLVMCSCVNPRKEFEQHFCWIWYITWQYMTSIFFLGEHIAHWSPGHALRDFQFRWTCSIHPRVPRQCLPEARGPGDVAIYVARNPGSGC